MSHRRMALVPADTLQEMSILAAAAVRLHDRQTHYGKCDVCDLIARWRGHAEELDLSVDEARKRRVG